MSALLRWVSHTGFTHRPMVSFYADVDDRWDPQETEMGDIDQAELRAELNTTRNALHLAVAENTELRAALERKRALVAALYDHMAATGSADGEPLRLLLADHVSAHPQETK
jgi:hypothetical protein